MTTMTYGTARSADGGLMPGPGTFACYLQPTVLVPGAEARVPVGRAGEPPSADRHRPAALSGRKPAGWIRSYTS